MSRVHTPLITKIKKVLEQDRRVVAAWLEGSIARDEEDDFSDIDLWIAVQDAAFDSFMDDREKFAVQLGAVVSVLYPKTSDQTEDSDSFQIILEDQPITTTIDVDVQRQTRNFQFTTDSAAEECRILFDTENVIRYKPFHARAVEEYARAVAEDVMVRFWHRVPKMIAHMERNSLLQAVTTYHEMLDDLITLYRIQYTPEKTDWGMKDIEYDLPEDVVQHIHRLLPEARTRTLTVQLQKLAATFLKQSKVTGKRLRIPLPDALISTIQSAL